MWYYYNIQLQWHSRLLEVPRATIIAHESTTPQRRMTSRKISNVFPNNTTDMMRSFDPLYFEVLTWDCCLCRCCNRIHFSSAQPHCGHARFYLFDMTTTFFWLNELKIDRIDWRTDCRDRIRNTAGYWLPDAILISLQRWRFTFHIVFAHKD